MKKFMFFWQRSVLIRIFLITSSMLFFTTAIVLILFFFIMPSSYKTFKTTQLNDGIKRLLFETKQTSLAESSDALENFALRYNVEFRIKDSNGHLVYSPTRFIRIKDGEPTIEKNPFNMNIGEEHQVYEYQNNLGNSTVLSITSPIFFTDGAYSITVNATMQPITETSSLLWNFIPYILALILLITVFSSLVFARMISMPLLEINNATKKMASLDFSVKLPVKRKDEIGQLATNFNILSSNLETSLDELKLANKRLLKDIERERKIEEQRREFIATISHELKSPITVVKGQLEGMIYGIGAYKDIPKYLRRSFVKIEEMENLVTEILAFSRLDTHEFKLDLQEISLNELILENIDKLDFFVKRNQLKMNVDIDNNIKVKSDKKLLDKVIHNVISNAIMYSPENESIFVKLKSEKNIVLFSVLNTGVHLEQENIAQLFQPFYRLEKSRNRNSGGSGLGLYIVKRALESLDLPFQMLSTTTGVLFEIAFKQEKSYGENIEK